MLGSMQGLPSMGYQQQMVAQPIVQEQVVHRHVPVIQEEVIEVPHIQSAVSAFGLRLEASGYVIFRFMEPLYSTQ